MHDTVLELWRMLTTRRRLAQNEEESVSGLSGVTPYLNRRLGRVHATRVGDELGDDTVHALLHWIGAERGSGGHR